jgi:hypothetical protein
MLLAKRLALAVALSGFSEGAIAQEAQPADPIGHSEPSQSSGCSKTGTIGAPGRPDMLRLHAMRTVIRLEATG